MFERVCVCLRILRIVDGYLEAGSFWRQRVHIATCVRLLNPHKLNWPANWPTIWLSQLNKFTIKISIPHEASASKQLLKSALQCRTWLNTHAQTHREIGTRLQTHIHACNRELCDHENIRFIERAQSTTAIERANERTSERASERAGEHIATFQLNTLRFSIENLNFSFLFNNKSHKLIRAKKQWNI